MPRGTWTAKDERKYEAILESCQFGKRRRSKKTCQRIAAATVNRDRGLGTTSKNSCPHAKRFGELVNMTPAEIRAWSKDPRSKLASWASTRARLPALAKLKAKPVAQWTEADCKFAARVVSFNSRMDGMRKEHGCTTKIDVSLRNWGRRAPGCKLPKKP